MAAPNLIGATTINGKTTGANLTTTSATSILNNASSSGKCLKINTLNVTNYTVSAASISVSWYNAASLGGTAYAIAGNIMVPANSTLNIIDKTSQYYLEENTSLGAIAVTANALIVTCSYEDIS
jgi:DUF4097 and DUF4098 domain-containing protein YvlB